MNTAKRFIKAFVFCQFGYCSGRILTKYISYKQHPAIYDAYSIPWYSNIGITIGLTALSVGISIIILLIINKKLKQENSQSTSKDI